MLGLYIALVQPLLAVSPFFILGMGILTHVISWGIYGTGLGVV